MSATFATISNRMRLNLFSRHAAPEPEHSSAPPPGTATVQPPSGKTFPADEVVWGIVIRNGFDELDDPWYHRGTTQHAYLEGNDNVAICGFRPPQSGPRTRRRSRLGLPTSGEHPMCGSCARMVVAPRPRVPVPVQAARPPVAVPVTRPAQPVPGQVPVAPAASVLPPPAPVAAATAPPQPAAPSPAAPPPPAPASPTSPWVRQRADGDQQPQDDNMTIDLGTRHDSGLLNRGVHAEPQD